MTHFLDLTTLPPELLACYEAEAAIEQQRRDAHNKEAARYSGVRPDYAGVDTFTPRQPAQILQLAEKRLERQRELAASPQDKLLLDITQALKCSGDAYHLIKKANEARRRNVTGERARIAELLAKAHSQFTDGLLAVMDAQLSLSDIEHEDEPAFAAIARNIVADLNAGLAR